MLDETQRTEAHKHLQRGLHLERAGRYDEAAEEYRQALSYNPHLREAHDAMASHYQRVGLLAKAADELRIVTNLEDDPIAYYNLGCMLAELGRYQEAQQAFSRYLREEPGDENALLELAYIDYAVHRYELALTTVQTLLPCFEGDWEVYTLAGSCCLRLGFYSQAADYFKQALGHTPSEEARDEVQHQLETVGRYSEFRKIRSLKDRIYAEEGVICLGSAQDNGILIPEYAAYELGERDVATTLCRLLDLLRAFRWPLTSVTSLDRASQPLARLLAAELSLPLRTPAELDADGYTLLVGGVVREPEFLEVATEQLPCQALSFFLAIPWLDHPTIAPPQIFGVAARVGALPWGARLATLLRDGASREAVEVLLEQATQGLAQALAQLPPDPFQKRQVRYYTERHRRLDIDPAA